MPYQRPRRIDEPEDTRTYRYLLTDVADALSAGGTLEITARWSAWDWCRFGARWLALGLILGAALLGILELLHPWAS